MQSESIIIGGPELTIAGASWHSCTNCDEPVALSKDGAALVREKGIEPYCVTCAFNLMSRKNTVVVAGEVPKR